MLVVDGAKDVRELLRMTLLFGGFEVAGLAGNGLEAVYLAEELQPDLILLDVHLPDVSGLDVLPELHVVSRRSRVVVHSAVGATFVTEGALAAGAVAYIEKGMSPRSIIEHLHRVTRSGKRRPVRPYPLNREYPPGRAQA